MQGDIVGVEGVWCEVKVSIMLQALYLQKMQ